MSFLIYFTLTLSFYFGIIAWLPNEAIPDISFYAPISTIWGGILAWDFLIPTDTIKTLILLSLTIEAIIWGYKVLIGVLTKFSGKNT